MSGYVTFKLDSDKGNECTLRSPEADQQLAGRLAMCSQLGPCLSEPGGGQPPAPSSEVYFRIGDRHPGTNILQLDPDFLGRVRPTQGHEASGSLPALQGLPASSTSRWLPALSQ